MPSSAFAVAEALPSDADAGEDEEPMPPKGTAEANAGQSDAVLKLELLLVAGEAAGDSAMEHAFDRLTAVLT